MGNLTLNTATVPRLAWLAFLSLALSTLHARGSATTDRMTGTEAEYVPTHHTVPVHAWLDSLTGRLPRMLAIRIPGESPSIDGVLDERCWEMAPPSTAFLQKEPVEGAIPLSATEVRVCYDASAIYFGATMFREPGADILTTMSRRDNTGNSERILFSLDTYFDHRTAYTFGVTASGVRVDYYHPEDQEYSRDYSFDPVWEARVSRTDSSWTVEVRIPFSQLRFSPGEKQTWGINMNRFVPTTSEDLYWLLIGKQETGWSSRFGLLEGIEGIHPHRPVEFIPYAAGNMTLDDRNLSWRSLGGATDFSGRAGIDVKLGLGSNLTVDATVNPDFGQVEADPAEVNLSAYETYFSERRPFFFEGNSILEGSGPRYFYSRRIGAPPHGRSPVPGALNPGSSTILGAGKVTGRLPSGLSIGGLTALTAREYAEHDPLQAQAMGLTTDYLVEPMTGYGVIRAQTEFGPSASTVGLMLTGVARDFTGGGPLEDVLVRQAVSGGGDCVLQFNNSEYTLRAYGGFSHLTGTEPSVLRIQQASAHYFQRPDAGHIDIDTTRTSMSGYTASVQMSRNSGTHWLWSFGTTMESPGFDLNNAGYLQSADDIESYGMLQYRETIPGSMFRQYAVYASVGSAWNFGGVHKGVDLALRTSLTWLNFWQTSIEFDYSLPGLSDDLTRGGPLMGTPASWSCWLGTSNYFAEALRWSLHLQTGRDQQGGWSYTAEAYLGYRPTGNWEFSLGPRYFRVSDPRQYIGTLPGGTAATFSQRYVFGTVDRGTLSFQFRFNYSFTPDLSLELYLEPFAASGRYSSFGELTAARSRDLRLYGTDGSTITLKDGYHEVADRGTVFTLPAPDFLVHSFRSNLVLRWEWLRGSTIYLVWQQDRMAQASPGGHVAPGDLFDSFGVTGRHFFALKASYWFTAF